VSMPRKWLRLLGVCLLACAVAVTYAAPASAMSKAQKRKAQKVLLKKLKKNPRLIKSKKFLRKAGHVDFSLPLTVRLNPVVDGGAAAGVQEAEARSDDTVNLDLSSTFGPQRSNVPVKVSGVVHVSARFGNPAEGDTLGDLRLVATGADLTTSTIPVLDNATAGATCNALGPQATTAPDNTLYAGGVSSGPGTTDTATQTPGYSVNTVVRTAPVKISLANITASADGVRTNLGKANLFSPPGSDVRLQLHVNASINTIFKSTENGTGASTLPLGAGALPSTAFLCDEAYAGRTSGTGTEGNIIPVYVEGALSISPAITTDGFLRLATVNVNTPPGKETHASARACLQVHSLVNDDANGDGLPTAGLGPSTIAGDALYDAGILASQTPGATHSPAELVSLTGPPSTLCNDPYNTGVFSSYPLAIDLNDGTDTDGAGPLTSEIQPATARYLDLDPEVEVLGLTGEALVGTIPDVN
jgi:hypothetical protein